MSSLTALILNNISHFRNPMPGEPIGENIVGRIAAEVVYTTIIPFVIVEIAISSVANALASICSSDCSSDVTRLIDNWTHSSINCLMWTIYAVAMNLFVTEMFTNEQQFVSTILPRSWISQNRLAAHFIGPPEVEPEVANLLNPYVLGPNATVPSEIMQRLYNDIPQPTDQELRDIGTQIADLLTDRVDAGERRGIKGEIDGFVIQYRSGVSAWDTRFVKMVVCIRKEILRRNDPSEIEIMKQAFKSAFGHCSNRKSREIERLFFAYVAPHLNADYVMSMTSQQCLIFDLTQHRMDFADKTINFHSMNDHHLATSSNVFHRHLNTSTFYLPPAPLSDVDLNHETIAAIENENAIKETFKRCYESPNTIYTVFLKLLYSHESSQEERDQFKFKPVMFTTWLQGLNSSDPIIADDPSLLEDPLTEDGNYKHALIVKFLAAMDCLTLRNSLNAQRAAS